PFLPVERACGTIFAGTYAAAVQRRAHGGAAALSIRLLVPLPEASHRADSAAVPAPAADGACPFAAAPDGPDRTGGRRPVRPAERQLFQSAVPQALRHVPRPVP